MEGKTAKPEFDKASGSNTEKPKRNYSHKELMQSLDRHASVAKEPADKKAMLDIKDDYVSDKIKTGVNRMQRRAYFRQGLREGIHNYSDLHDMERDEHLADERKRENTLNEAKDYYHRHYSLTKSFREKNTPIPKGRPMDKGKD